VLGIDTAAVCGLCTVKCELSVNFPAMEIVYCTMRYVFCIFYGVIFEKDFEV
jgi:hypothetical protein